VGRGAHCRRGRRDHHPETCACRSCATRVCRWRTWCRRTDLGPGACAAPASSSLAKVSCKSELGPFSPARAGLPLGLCPPGADQAAARSLSRGGAQAQARLPCSPPPHRPPPTYSHHLADSSMRRCRKAAHGAIATRNTTSTTTNATYSHE
jgi:hypothetical protein